MLLYAVKYLKTQINTIVLLPENVHPENTIYYNSAFVIEALQSNDRQGMFDLYQEVREKQKMSFPVFILCLDWLFLLDVAEFNDGIVKLCS